MLDALRRLLSFARAALAGTLRSLRANWGLALLSLLLAFVLWIFVTEGQNPTRSGIFPLGIPVEPANLPPGMAMVGAIEPIKVRISAPEDVWDRLAVEDFRAVADLSQASLGQQTAPVHVRVVGKKDVQVESMVPERVAVRLGPWVRRAVPVMLNFIGSPALGYELGQGVTNPQQVAVAGAEELVNQVEAAVADINVFGVTAKIGRSVKLVPRDNRGLVIEGVALDPEVAQVEAAVERRVFTNSYVVSPARRGEPAPGYNVTNVRVDPSIVTLLGPQEALESLSSLTAVEVDISGARSDVIQRVSLQLPSGVKAAGGDTVLVWVSIEPAPGEATFGVAPRWQGVDPSLAARPLLGLVEVRLAGPLPLLRTLSPDQVVVIADLSGLGKGMHRLELQVQVPTGLRLVAVAPATLEVELVPSS